MNRKILLSIAIAVAVASCNQKKDTESRELAKADWLEGTWVNNSPYGNLSESWQRENDSLYRGESYFIKGKDTIHSETITLSERDGVVFYCPTVQGQNGDKPVDFKMVSATADLLVFENPTHDFPQKITYKKVNADSLVAEISGVQQGKPSSEQFSMSRKR